MLTNATRGGAGEGCDAGYGNTCIAIGNNSTLLSIDKGTVNKLSLSHSLSLSLSLSNLIYRQGYLLYYLFIHLFIYLFIYLYICIEFVSLKTTYLGILESKPKSCYCFFCLTTQ